MTATDEIADALAARLAALADNEAARIRNELLEHLHRTGAQPPPVIAARLARSGELPRAATTLLAAVVEPWRARAHYALGSAAYSWNHRSAGWMLAEHAYVKAAHPDGRYVAACWSRDQVAERGKTGSKTWQLVWHGTDAWRWRVGPATTSPRRIGLTALKVAVGDPTWHENPYVIEEAAA